MVKVFGDAWHGHGLGHDYQASHVRASVHAQSLKIDMFDIAPKRLPFKPNYTK